MKSAVVAFVKNEEDKFLLLYHKEQDYWTPPGGKIEPNETPIRAMIRELKEEINFPDFETNWHICTSVNKVTDTITHECGDKNWILKLYYVDKFPENFYQELNNNEPEKHTDMQWFTIDEIRNLEKVSYSVTLLLGMYKALDEYVEYSNLRDC
mgnify:FL=1